MVHQASGADLEADLNPAQLEAVRSVEGPHLVVAGAGTGKTRTLVCRVAHLVSQGVSPESILLLTFTRRAAREMLRRASSMLDARCERVAGGTFHSFANLVLRRWAGRVGFSRDFTIHDRGDSAELLGGLRSELGLDRRERRFPRKDTLADLFSKHVNTNRPLVDLVEDEMPQFLEELETLQDLLERYRRRKAEEQVMDYDDLLVYLRRLLVEHEDVRARLSRAYRYIMVDEYQDTNRLQAHITALLASAHGNLMVVGDDAQSIYSFRGADFRNIMDFPQIFPDCQITVLEENYRSSQPVLDLGNRIIEVSRERYVKHLWSRRPGEERPLFVRTVDDHEQAVFVCRRILELREEGVPLSDIAVLSRAAWHSNSLEIELQNRNLPFRKFGGIRFVEAAHVKDVAAVLKIGLNRLDTTSWKRVLQLLDGIGPRRADQISSIVLESGGDVERALTTQFRAARYGSSLRELCDLLPALADAHGSVADAVEAAVEWYAPFLAKKYDDAKRRERDLEALLVIAGRYVGLERFLTDIAIEPPEFGRDPHRDSEDEWITVSTVHSAKGLEWDTVFVLNLTNGHFPLYSAMDDPASYEEERRLLYVAVTRCKRRLMLMKPEIVPGRFAGVGETSPLLRDVKGFRRLVVEHRFVAHQDPEELPAGERPPRDERRMARIQEYFEDPD